MLRENSTCFLCGEENLGKWKRRFCSKKCSGTFWNKRRLKGVQSFKNCLVCNTRFPANRSVVTCSEQCKLSRLKAKITESNDFKKKKAREAFALDGLSSWRRYTFKKVYKITPDFFYKKIQECDNSCEVCGEPFGLQKDIQVDHSHKSGLFRGLLCKHCNHGLGHFFDDVKKMRAAILYLQKDRVNLTKLHEGGYYRPIL